MRYQFTLKEKSPPFIDMKYIIPESQIGRILFNYLDSKDFYINEHEGDYYFYISELSWKDSERPVISYHKRYDDCFITSDLLEEMSGFFSLNLDQSLRLISDWVENKLGVDIDYPYSDVGAD